MRPSGWTQRRHSKRLRQKFRASPGALPSDFVSNETSLQYADLALKTTARKGVPEFGVRIHGAGEYPPKLRDARYPIELLYYRGWWNLVETRSVAVVGTRSPSVDGLKRAAKLASLLVRDGFTVVSGLARGIDTAALTTALASDGQVIAVIGTAICDYYPRENMSLQDKIAGRYLLVSQVPIVRSSRQRPLQNRVFFPERNITMSALTEATVIVEAGETSGTLTQARAAIQQFFDDILTAGSHFRAAKLLLQQRFGNIPVRRNLHCEADLPSRKYESVLALIRYCCGFRPATARL